MKLAGLEALVSEVLANDLILNSNRLRTFEDARLEIVTYVEPKFGLRIRDARPGEAVRRVQSDPSMQSTLFRPAKQKRRRVHMAGASRAAERDRIAQAIVWQRQAERQIMVQELRAKEKAKKVRENPKEIRKVSRERNIRTRAKALRKAYQRRIPRKTHTQTALGVTTVGVALNGMTDGVRLDGMKAGIRCMTIRQDHFLSEVFDLGAMRVVLNGLNG